MKTRIESNAVAETLIGLVAGLVKGLVRNPELVHVNHSIHGDLVAVVLRTHPDDTRRLIGAQGRNLKAITTLAEEYARRHGFEAHIAIDERNPSISPAFRGTWSPQKAGRHLVESFKQLLFDSVRPFADVDADKVEIIAAEAGPTIIFEVKTTLKVHLCVYGTATQFDYGVDGHVIGALKRLFDAIAKSHGMLVRITLSYT